MSFQVQSGGAQAVQNLTVNTPNPTTIWVTVPANQTWLKVNGNPSGTVFDTNTQATLPIQVNTAGLQTGSNYQANIQMYIAGQQNTTTVNFPVSLTVGTPSLLSSSPANITFSAVQGNSFGSPTSIPVTVSSSGPALNYNVTPSTTTGGNWLLVTNTSSIPTSSTTAGFSVSVNASNLSAGTYNGLLSIQSTTTGDSTTIPVTLSVTTGASLNITPSTLNNFVYQAGSGAGSFQPETQSLMISTNSGSLNYQISATAVSGPALTTNWLVISPNGGLATSTPQTINLSLSFQGVQGLSPGTYVTDLNISPTAGGGNTTTIPVSLVVSTNGILTVNNSSLTFTVPFGSTTTQSQTVQVSSSNGSSVPYYAQTNQSWLAVSPTSGNTSSNSAVTISVNASGLNLSSTPYTGTVTLYPQNSDASLYNVQINVTLTVTSATTTIYAAPAALLFSYETTVPTPALQSQQVQLSSAGTVGFSPSAIQMTGSNCPTTTWLGASANQNVTPATLTVSVNGTGMTAGFCTGTVVVTYNNGSTANTTVNIPVTVNIAPAPLLTVTPSSGFGVVTATLGSSSVLSSTIFIGSTDGSALGYSAFASTPNAPVAWLSLGNSEGPGQEYLQVYVVPSGLPVGVYTGSITINANTGANLPSGQFVLPVVLTISASTTVAVTPTSLTFTQPQGATTAPASQTLTLTATGGTTGFTASVTQLTGGAWLQITPLSGTASGTITASVAPGNTLSVGTYTSDIIVKYLNAASPPATIPVSLVVTSAQTVTVSTTPPTTPTALSFSYQLGSATPATQTLNVTSTGGTVPVTVTAASTPAWLSVTPATGSTGASGAPLTLTVSVNPAVITTAQTYTGTITVTPTGQAAISIPVTLTVSGVAAPSLVSISNSASGAFSAISPGELITIKGTNLGPTTASTFTVSGTGTVSNTLAGVQVLFGTTPGTPIYVSQTQINVIVPYEIAGQASTSVSVTYLGQPSAGIQETIANQAPGTFTDSSTGQGQGSVLNQNYSLNGPATGLVIGGQNIPTTPAAEGSVISVFMTGGGQTNPVSSTGTVTPGGTLYKIPGTISATIGGVNAPVQFAGAAPGEVTGVVQVNLLVPTGISGNALPLLVTINGVTSQTGVTVAVQ